MRAPRATCDASNARFATTASPVQRGATLFNDGRRVVNHPLNSLALADPARVLTDAAALIDSGQLHHALVIAGFYWFDRWYDRNQDLVGKYDE